MSSYFSEVPNFEYVSRLPDAKISDYITVKNFFKKGLVNSLEFACVFASLSVRNCMSTFSRTGQQNAPLKKI